MVQHVLSILDVKEELSELIALAVQVKREPGRYSEALKGQTLALIFEKASTRTRVSFETLMAQTGGTSLFLSSHDLQMGRGEPIADTARVLSRYVEAIAYRARSSRDVAELASHATIPVINALDDTEHPCQVLADLLTLHERWEGVLAGKKLVWLGDGNNVCHSLMLGAALQGLEMVVAHPPEYPPDAEMVALAAQLINERGSGSLVLTHDAGQAMEGARAVYTDVWVSMGDEAEREQRLVTLAPYQLNASLLALAAPQCLVLHCLPAHRGEEITAEVLEGPQAASVWDQAENRLHAQKALLLKLLGAV